MLGVLVNSLAVIIGGLIGLLFRRGIPQTISQAVMVAIRLATV